MLELTGVSRHFGGLHAISGVNMSIPQGKVVGLIGPNGAGKTTLINCVSGLDHPTGGRIVFAEQDITRRFPHAITRLGIARTYQNIRLFGEMTALENLLVSQHALGKATLFGALVFTPGYRSEERRLRENALHLLDRFGLAPAADVEALTLPYGDQRRLELRAPWQADRAAADEPTAGMNPVETHDLGEQIIRLRAEGLTVLVIEHDMSLIQQVCDAIYVLNFGQIIAHGTHDEIRHNRQVIEAYLGEDETDGAA
ncbi:MAG: ABC transporter ATP-binding protein [Anaerolineae bacterium]|nr:ABC transporter ATP-binding protein [Anaerolineae bacterium]